MTIELAKIIRTTKTASTVSDADYRAAFDTDRNALLAALMVKANRNRLETQALRIASAPFIFDAVESGTDIRDASAAWHYGVTNGKPSNNTRSIGVHLHAVGALIVRHGLATSDPVVIRFAATALVGKAKYNVARDYVTETSMAEFDLDHFVGLLDAADSAPRSASATSGNTEPDTEPNTDTEPVRVPDTADALTMLANIAQIVESNPDTVDRVAVVAALHALTQTLAAPIREAKSAPVGRGAARKPVKVA